MLAFLVAVRDTPLKACHVVFVGIRRTPELVAYAIAIVRSTKTLQRSEALCGANDVALPQGLAPLELAAFFSGL